jgi:hypothetical protein
VKYDIPPFIELTLFIVGHGVLLGLPGLLGGSTVLEYISSASFARALG